MNLKSELQGTRSVKQMLAQAGVRFCQRAFNGEETCQACDCESILSFELVGVGDDNYFKENVIGFAAWN
jgi:hypothetical protein